MTIARPPYATPHTAPPGVARVLRADIPHPTGLARIDADGPGGRPA
jgi:hypothetical protein